jgi:hypothetical protein
MNFPPENECQIVVIVSELTEPFTGNLVDMVRTTAARTDQIPRDHSASLQTRQTLPDRRGRDSDTVGNLLHRAAAEAVQLIQKFPIGMVKCCFHK